MQILIIRYICMYACMHCIPSIYPTALRGLHSIHTYIHRYILYTLITYIHPPPPYSIEEKDRVTYAIMKQQHQSQSQSSQPNRTRVDRLPSLEQIALACVHHRLLFCRDAHVLLHLLQLRVLIDHLR